MSRLPSLTAVQVVKARERGGFRRENQKGTFFFIIRDETC